MNQTVYLLASKSCWLSLNMTVLPLFLSIPSGEPTAKNPHPTLYLNGHDVKTKIQANQVIEKWKKDHLKEHQEYVNESFHSETSKTARKTMPVSPNSKTARKTMLASSPAKRRNLLENGEPSSSPAKRTRLMESDTLTNSSSPGRRTRLMEPSENSSSPAKLSAINRMVPQSPETSTNKVNHTGNTVTPTKRTRSTDGESEISQVHVPMPNGMGNTEESVEPPKLPLPSETDCADKDVMDVCNGLGKATSSKDTKGTEQSYSQSANSKGSTLTNSKEQEKSLLVENVGSTKNDASVANVDQTLLSGHTSQRDNVTRITEPDGPPKLEPQVDRPVSAIGSPNKSIPKLKIIDELAELKDLLDKTLQNSGKDVQFPAIDNAEELKREILNQSGNYPRVLLTRYPLPEGFDYKTDNFSVKNATALCPLKTVGVSDKTMPMDTLTRQVKDQNTKIPKDDGVQILAKEDVPYSSKTKELDGDSELKSKEDISLDKMQLLSGNDTDKPLSSENQPNLVANKPDDIIIVQPESQSPHQVPQSNKEKAGGDDDIQEIEKAKSTCENCAHNLVQIKSITSQMKAVKKQIKMVIRSNKELISRNRKLDLELLVAKEHIKKLEAQNMSLKTTVAAFGKSPGGQLVRTPDGRLFRLTNKQQPMTNQIVMQAPTPQPMLSSPTIINQPNQPNLINTAQPGMIQNQPQVQMTNVVQQQPSLNIIPQPTGVVTPTQNVAQPTQPQLFLRIGPANASANNQPGNSVPVSMGLHVVAPSTSIASQQIANTNLMQGPPQIPQGQGQPPFVQTTNLTGQKTVSLMPQALNAVQQQPVVQQSVNGQLQIISNAMSQQVQTNVVPQQEEISSQSALPQPQSLTSQVNASMQQTKPNLSTNKKSVDYAFAVPNQGQPPRMLTQPSSSRPMPPLSQISVQPKRQIPPLDKPANNQKMSSGKCTVCQYLAREVQRLRKQKDELKAEFDVMDKINTRVVEMFVPASPAFCALIGMEQIKT